MKKFIIAALALSFMSAPAFAHGRRGHWHGGHWVAPAIVGTIIGGALLYNYPYDRPRQHCFQEQIIDGYGRPVFDAYGQPVMRVVCR